MNGNRPPHASGGLLSSLVGGRNDPRQQAPATRPGQPDMLRNDGTQKGRGYLGPKKNTAGQTMTEYSIGVEFDGKETEIPTMVPTLSPQELQYLTSMQQGMPIPPGIQQKAVDHALMRMQQGLPIFHDNGPQHARRLSELPYQMKGRTR